MAKWYFQKLPTRDITSGDVTSGLRRNTSITMGIYTNSGRTTLASVWADAAGSITKTNPVELNVGGNNAFDGYLTPGILYYTRIGAGASATDGELFAGNKFYTEGASFRGTEVRNFAGVDVGSGYGIQAGRNYFLPAGGLPDPHTGSHHNGYPAFDFMWCGFHSLTDNHSQLETRNARFSMIGEPLDFIFERAGSYNDEWENGGADGQGGTPTRILSGTILGKAYARPWVGNSYEALSHSWGWKMVDSVGLPADMSAGRYSYDSPTYANYDVPPYGIYEDKPGVPGTYRHKTTLIDAPVGTAVAPSVATGAGYQLQRLGYGSEMFFGTAPRGWTTHAPGHVRWSLGAYYVFMDASSGAAEDVDDLARPPWLMWLRSADTTDNDPNNSNTHILLALDRGGTLTLNKRVGMTMEFAQAASGQNRRLGTITSRLDNASNPRGTIILSPHNNSETYTDVLYVESRKNVGINLDPAAATNIGQGVLAIGKATVNPSTAPTNASYLYTDASTEAFSVQVEGGQTYVFAKTPQTYSITNVTTDRAYDANATTTDELADALGTLIADLRAIGLVL